MRLWPSLRYYPGILLQILRKTKQGFSTTVAPFKIRSRNANYTTAARCGLLKKANEPFGSINDGSFYGICKKLFIT